jgi:transcriptional regulator with XRE-family HTH domain
MFNIIAWEASGLTIKALAEAAGVSFSTAWRWIHKGATPSPLARRRLVKLGLWAHQRAKVVKPTQAQVDAAKRILEAAAST